jgi:putative ATP-dependent endonuclease of the OLD family
LAPEERAAISLAHRRSRQEITDDALGPINKRIAKASEALHDRPIGLQMDQSSRSSWEAGVVPQVEDIPFALAGEGQQAAIKVALAMSRTVGAATFVLIEEPENHLSYSSLTRLVARIERLAAEEQQLFISTHSSFVANRLGLDRPVASPRGPHRAADRPRPRDG